MSRPIESGLIRIFRYFTMVALFYFAILIVYIGFVTRQGVATVQIQWYINFAGNLFLFFYLSWPSLQKRLHGWYLPLALGVSAAAPVLSNLIFLFPQGNTLKGVIVDPTWLLFPSLLVTLVLIAWQYSFAAVLIFVFFSALVELVVLDPFAAGINAQTLALFGLPLVRAFAFGIVGQVVCHLMAVQRAQRRELVRANIQISQHAATLEQLATSRERNRLARELHDTMAHTLSGQTVNLEAIKLMLPPGQAEIQAMLDHSLEISRDGLAEVRRALKDLRSKTLEDLGLAIAIRNLATKSAARADFALDLDIQADLPRLESDLEQTVFRIVQKSFSNIVHHAGAQKVNLRLGMQSGLLTLAIQDDGCGLDPQNIDYSNQHGLLGMQERAAMAGGKLTVHSQPGNGTRIDFSLEVPGD